VLAFLAFGYLVTAVGNDARVKCEELLLKHPKPTPVPPLVRRAIEQRARDFESAYRWFLRIASVIAVFLAVYIVLGHGGFWQRFYLGGVLFTLLVMWAFYRREARSLAHISQNRLDLSRRLLPLLGTHKAKMK